MVGDRSSDSHQCSVTWVCGVCNGLVLLQGLLKDPFTQQDLSFEGLLRASEARGEAFNGIYRFTRVSCNTKRARRLSTNGLAKENSGILKMTTRNAEHAGRTLCARTHFILHPMELMLHESSRRWSGHIPPTHKLRSGHLPLTLRSANLRCSFFIFQQPTGL